MFGWKPPVVEGFENSPEAQLENVVDWNLVESPFRFESCEPLGFEDSQNFLKRECGCLESGCNLCFVVGFEE